MQTNTLGQEVITLHQMPVIFHRQHQLNQTSALIQMIGQSSLLGQRLEARILMIDEREDF